MRLQKYGWNDVGMRPANNQTVIEYVKWSDVEYAAAQQQALTCAERDLLRPKPLLQAAEALCALRLDEIISAGAWVALLDDLLASVENDAIRRCLIQQLPGSSP